MAHLFLIFYCPEAGPKGARRVNTAEKLMDNLHAYLCVAGQYELKLELQPASRSALTFSQKLSTNLLQTRRGLE